MLTYPDRQKFEQIRARWEAVRLGEDTPAEMVGWREKSMPQQPVNGEPQENGSSRFRRKLSHGLAFISNPLSQRKTTPGRHQANVPLLAATELSTTDVTTATPLCETLHSSTRRFTPPNDSPSEPTTLAANDISPKNVDANATPKPLPRSRTLSFIPLPVRTEQESFSADVEGAVKSQSFAAMPQPIPDCAPSKIPTPSPPLPERRQSSPRQYLHHYASYHAAQQIKHIAAAHAAAAGNGSPVRPQQPLRSRTTPNFVNGSQVSQPARYMAPRRPGPKRPALSPMAQKPFLQENFPIDKHITHRRSQIQEGTLKRETLAVPGTLNGRRSFGPSSSLAQNRSHSFATPPTARRLTSHLAQQTPVTVKRIQPQGQPMMQGPEASPKMVRSPMVQPRRTGPPPTSTPPTVDIPMPSTLPRSHTDRDLQRKTLGTPNGLGGVWRSSRALAVTTHEVSRLPRSHTFHSFETQRELAPPVPPIPDQYRTPSLSDLTQRLRIRSDMPIKPRHTRIISDATSCASIPETDEETNTPMYKPCETGRMPSFMDPAGSTISLTAFPPVPTALPSFTSPCAIGNSQFYRQHSMSGLRGLGHADVNIFQVKDYMPPLYWAGRFTSRYDQWRTDAMIKELDLNSDHQISGPLSDCKLNQEKLAKCYIFGQLRDLCTSDQAADSLWEFEYKYRRDHRMLGNHLDLPPMPSRKQDDNTTSTGAGAFGRAMRKLTPRKASLVNLMKGKGWNKSDEMRNNNLPDHNQETSSEES